MNFIIVTVGFFLEDEVTFTLIFLEDTVKVVPFFAGAASLVTGAGVGVGSGVGSGVTGVTGVGVGITGVGTGVGSGVGFGSVVSSPDASPGVAVSPINLTGILFSSAYSYALEFL